MYKIPFLFFLISSFLSNHVFGMTCVRMCLKSNPDHCEAVIYPYDMDCKEFTASYPDLNPNSLWSIDDSFLLHPMILHEGFDPISNSTFNVSYNDNGLIFKNLTTGKNIVLMTAKEINDFPNGRALHIAFQENSISIYDAPVILPSEGQVISPGMFKFYWKPDLIKAETSIKAEVYPIPSTDKNINIQLSEGINDAGASYFVDIYDVTGRCVFNSSIRTGITSISLESLKSGIYVCNISSSILGQVESGKIILE